MTYSGASILARVLAAHKARSCPLPQPHTRPLQRDKDSVGAFALELVILTAARTGEVLGAKWSEIDVESKIWTVNPWCIT
ncbi:hypothetical protein [Methylocella sp.]|jgi:integrase|uniref:hypothetical protein n=1 Tax=Methylocella sp. TaxID=1978226 RepID=UPI003C1AE583